MDSTHTDTPDSLNAPPPWASSLQRIQRPVATLPSLSARNSRVKWGGVTHRLPNRPETWFHLQDHLLPHDRDPRQNDVLAGRVVELGRHRAVELSTGRRAELHLGDILVGAFGNRYATCQYEGAVPARQDYYHMLSQGAVFGQVVSAASSMSDPTIIEPLGFLSLDRGEAANLQDYGLASIDAPRVPTLLIVGASMDAGKTTTAAGVIHGLSLAGWRVHAGKLTGTGCANDINKMLDAGAERVLDFTHCGWCSTAQASDESLRSISDTLITQLSLGQPDILVLEIADGIVQRETGQLVRMLAAAKRVDGALLAIHDVLSASQGVRLVEEEFGVPLVGLSGMVTRSPLSVAELRSVTSQPVFDLCALSDPSIALALAPLMERGREQRAREQLQGERAAELPDFELARNAAIATREPVEC